mmetsp:Transcript_8562/g.25467  ORF Transcript_8562/g.25467 Transcript_8562/m.25467 type:complete len:265 (-) Transcript_8562:242-1036(-)
MMMIKYVYSSVLPQSRTPWTSDQKVRNIGTKRTILMRRTSRSTRHTAKVRTKSLLPKPDGPKTHIGRTPVNTMSIVSPKLPLSHSQVQPSTAKRKAISRTKKPVSPISMISYAFASSSLADASKPISRALASIKTPTVISKYGERTKRSKRGNGWTKAGDLRRVCSFFTRSLSDQAAWANGPQNASLPRSREPFASKMFSSMTFVVWWFAPAAPRPPTLTRPVASSDWCILARATSFRASSSLNWPRAWSSWTRSMSSSFRKRS